MAVTHRLYRRDRARHRVLRHRTTSLRSTSTRSIRRSPRQMFPAAGGGWDRGGAARVGPEPVLRHRRGRGVRHARDRFSAASCCGRSRNSATSSCTRSTDGWKRQYHAVSIKLDKRTAAQNWWGGRFSYTWSQHEGQPVRREQRLRMAHGRPAEQLRPGRRVRHEQLRLAAPDHPGADRPDCRGRRTAAACVRAARRLERSRRSSSW